MYDLPRLGSPPVSAYPATATARGDEVEATRGPPRGPGPVLPRRLLCSIWRPKKVGNATSNLYELCYALD